MSDPKEGDLKVWWIPQVPMEAFEVPVKTPEEAAMLLTVLAEYDAFQYLNKVKGDYSNAGGLQVFEGGDWSDWESYDEDDHCDDPKDLYPQPSLGWCERLNE